MTYNTTYKAAARVKVGMVEAWWLSKEHGSKNIYIQPDDEKWRRRKQATLNLTNDCHWYITLGLGSSHSSSANISHSNTLTVEPRWPISSSLSHQPALLNKNRSSNFQNIYDSMRLSLFSRLDSVIAVERNTYIQAETQLIEHQGQAGRQTNKHLKKGMAPTRSYTHRVSTKNSKCGTRVLDLLSNRLECMLVTNPPWTGLLDGPVTGDPRHSLNLSNLPGQLIETVRLFTNLEFCCFSDCSPFDPNHRSLASNWSVRVHWPGTQKHT
jgi:hypothetical protein